MKEIGPIVPIVTPCQTTGEFDPVGFDAVCQEMLDAGAKGIFVAGSTGRGPWFSLTEKAALCRRAADKIAGKVPLLAGCTASGLPGMLEAAKTMADSGAKIAVATAPGYFHYSENELETIFLEFADASPLPVIIYDIPEFTNMKFSIELVQKLANHGNVVGMKDSSDDFNRFIHLVGILKAYPDFYLLQGKEKYLVDSLKLGVSGFVVSLIHLSPRSFTSLYQAVKSGDLQQADTLQAQVTHAFEQVHDAIVKRPESSTLFLMLNYALRQRGVCQNILLAQDEEAPAWLLESAQRAIEVFKVE